MISVIDSYGGNDTPEFLALNPNGTIPVLKDGNSQPLWETGAILRYLAGRYGDEAFWPSGPVARAEIDKWAEWSKINIAMNFTAPIFWRVVRTAPQDRDEDAIRSALRVLSGKLEIAEAQLQKHAFLAGENFTLADIQLGHILYRYFDIAIARAELPAVRRYYERLAKQPAFVEHVMLPYDELRVT